MKCCSMQGFSIYKRVNDQYSVYRGGESDIKSVLILFSHLGLIARKPVFGVSEKASFKQVSSATQTG